MTTTEGLEAPLETLLDRWACNELGTENLAALSIACELRALRLMLQFEIREAAWRVSGDRYVKRDD